MSMAADELLHVIKQMVAQAVIETRSWVYGHLTAYDPNTHSARVMVPSMRDDQTGAMLHSGWLPMLTTQVAGTTGQSGLQANPHAAATQEDLSAGEQVMVALNERGTGVAAIVGMMYNNTQPPPNSVLAANSVSLNPGEVVLRHESGSQLRHHQNGDVELAAAGNMNISSSTDNVVGGNGNPSNLVGTSVNMEGLTIILNAPSMKAATEQMVMRGGHGIQLISSEEITLDAGFIFIQAQPSGGVQIGANGALMTITPDGAITIRPATGQTVTIGVAGGVAQPVRLANNTLSTVLLAQ